MVMGKLLRRNYERKVDLPSQLLEAIRGRIGNSRARRRQRYLFAADLHTGNFSRWRRLAHVPLANAVTLPALGEIEMDMAFMMAVGAGPEHGGEARAGAGAQVLAQILGCRHVG